MPLNDDNAIGGMLLAYMKSANQRKNLPEQVDLNQKKDVSPEDYQKLVKLNWAHSPQYNALEALQQRQQLSQDSMDALKNPQANPGAGTFLKEAPNQDEMAKQRALQALLGRPTQ